MRRLTDVGVVASASGVCGEQERARHLASYKEPFVMFSLHRRLYENQIAGPIPTEVGHLVDLESL